MPASVPETDVMATEGEKTAEIAAAEARGDTKIARLETKLDLVIAKIETVNQNTLETRRDLKNSERAVKTNARVLAVGIFAVLMALAFGLPAVIDFGTKLWEGITKAVQELRAN
jgi:hypothetical protein